MPPLPQFGDSNTQNAVDRPAAYALLRTTEGIAVVRTATGALFLPGGGMQEGETPEATVLRELLEECRIEAAALGRHVEAVQFFTVRDGTAYRSHMFFIECRLVRAREGPVLGILCPSPRPTSMPSSR